MGFRQIGPLQGGQHMVLQLSSKPVVARPVRQPKAGFPHFAPVPVSSMGPRLFGSSRGIIQRAVNNVVNVVDVRFTQASVSPTFSSIPSSVSKNLANLDSSAKQISTLHQLPA